MSGEHVVVVPAERALVESMLETYRATLRPGREREYILRQIEAGAAYFDLQGTAMAAMAARRMRTITPAHVDRVLEEELTPRERAARDTWHLRRMDA